MLRIRIRTNPKCPSHPRFTARDPGAARAACPACSALARVELQRRALMSAIANAEVALGQRHILEVTLKERRAARAVPLEA